MTGQHKSNSGQATDGLRWLNSAWIWWPVGAGAFGFLVWVLVRLWLVLRTTDRSSEAMIAALRIFFDELGPAGSIAYVLIVAIEVVIAPVPGLILYAPGGLVFGPWLGGLLALAGNMLGAGLACGLSRRLGYRWIARMDPADRTGELRVRLEQRGFLVIAVLRMNPLTSSDLISYAAGLTSIPIRTVVTGTGVGIAPLCFAQSWLSDGVFRVWPGLFWPLALITPIYLGIVFFVLVRLSRAK
ncbi:MAG: VTT domain-containing protein [Planctomycetia bacterium]